VTIHVSVECKKRWFGFQNVMEAVLSDKVHLTDFASSSLIYIHYLFEPKML
jgi:hypothetical protein